MRDLAELDADRFSFLEQLVIPEVASAGRYCVRFARTEDEVRAAQSLRYHAFYAEKKGAPPSHMLKEQRDIDEWDDAGFHIVVLDTHSDIQPKVVGTLRLFFNECLRSGQGFYTECAFDLSKLHGRYSRSLELSRFCIDSNERGGVILMLIWKYAMIFLQDNHIDVMFGCASFDGVEVERHLPILSYLYDNHLAPESLCPEPRSPDYIDLHHICRSDTVLPSAHKSIPTLLKGYLKLGAKISDAAIVDPVFNTTFVAIYVETQQMLQEKPSLLTRQF